MTTQALTAPRLDPHLIYGLDAVVSAVMGIALIAAATPLTELAGWPLPPTFLSVLGWLLLPWAAYNLIVARTARPARAMITANLFVDGAWVIGTVALLAIYAASLTPLGMTLLAGQGIAVFGVFLIKLIGARSLV